VSPLLDITAPDVGVADGIALRPGAVASEKQWNRVSPGPDRLLHQAAGGVEPTLEVGTILT
jgi:hypothetical protein